MSHCKECNKDTESIETRFKDAVFATGGEYIDVYVYSCAECGAHKEDESYVGE